jgi:acetyl-CoA carboxylase biotin carboxyl carrier protein
MTEQPTESMHAEPAVEVRSEDATEDATDAAPPASRRDGAEAADSADTSLLNLVARLSALLDRTDLTELEVQVGSTGLVLRKPSALAPTTPASVQATPGTASGPEGAAASSVPAEAAAPAARPGVMAPLSGIWYGAPAPGSAPYVTLGGEVAVGQVIGLIEAMKLFNEIKSDKAGRVVKINAEDGKLVRAKQPLIEVDPL